MAGDWLKFEVNTPEKPEVLAITIEMGWDDPDLTVGKLLRVWRWFDQHTQEGNAKNVTPALLDRLIGVSGLCAAMESVGWLVVDEGGVTLPNFDKHNGATAKNRVETARRVAKHRANGGRTAESQGDKPQSLPRPLRKAIQDRDGNTCVYCGRKEGEYVPPETPRDALMCIDHVVPKSKGGSDDINNLVCACSSCNQYKSDRTPDECGLKWPTDKDGKRFGNEENVTTALPREDIDIDINNPPNPPAGGESPQDEKPKRERKPRIQLKTFIENCKTAGETAISGYKPLLEYVEATGLPMDFVQLAWEEFKRQFGPGGKDESRKQADWRRHFLNYVEKNYMRLWYAKVGEYGNEYLLTTQGLQAQALQANREVVA